jgi:hypothetical protein
MRKGPGENDKRVLLGGRKGGERENSEEIGRKGEREERREELFFLVQKKNLQERYKIYH